MASKITTAPSSKNGDTSRDLAHIDEALGLGERAEERSDRARVEHLAKRASELVTEFSSLSSWLVETAKTLDEVREIAGKGKVLVQGEKCLRCSSLQGEPHRLGTCTALARVEEIQERLARV
jgi:hypothetical protein